MNTYFIDVVFYVWYIFVKGGDNLSKAGERVRLIREYFGLTMADFGSRFGVTRASISNIENGNRGLTTQMASSICKEFGVSEEWLRNGIGGDEIVFERTANDAAAAFAKENGLENIEEVLLREYLQLEDKERETFRKYLKNVLRDLYGADPAKEAAADREDMPAASAKKKPSEEMTIDEKVSSYRAELEAEETIRTLEASPTGSAGGAKDA